MVDHLVHVKRGAGLEHVVNRAPELAGEDGVALELAILLFQSPREGIEILVVAFA